MQDQRRTFCIIMGGGTGTRMYPLTRYRAKPAVPLGGRYRLIDVPISNCLNSGFDRIVVLTQYASESLNKHIFRTYKLDTFSGGFVEILAADQSYEKHEWFQGTADSVRKCLSHVNDPDIEEVIVLSGDQLYALDLRKLQDFHRKNEADVTIACYPEPANRVHHFGIMGINQDRQITSFLEKPKDASLIKGKPVLIDKKPHYLANMGIYIFKKDALTKLLSESDKNDFGKGIIPDAIGSYKLMAYVFDDYWSDIGTIASYYEASLMLTDPVPRFNLYNEDWQIYTRPRYLPPAKILQCQIRHSIIVEGCIIDDATLEHSVVGVRSRIGKKTRIEGVVINGNDYYEAADVIQEKRKRKEPLMGIGSDCVIQKAIIDKNVCIGNRVKIVNKKGLQEADEETYSIRDGIVVVHKGAVIPDGTVI